ncbi:MAG: hypothetical protein INR62_01135 [Rhodospirillales bacterium]|nr:hypothetical protein [Acetobacter sp.]
MEEQFYLLWPSLLLWVGLRRGLHFAGGIICLEPLLRIATHFLLPPLRGSFMIMLPWTLDPLMFGAAAALCEGQPRFERWWVWMGSGWVAAAAAAVLLVASPLLTLKFKGGYDVMLAPTLQSGAIVFILLWLVRQHDTLAGRLFNLPAVATVGVLSYSLYLWQQIFLVFWHDHLWTLQCFPINFACCFAAAAVSYYLIETPFLRWKTRFARVRVG